MIKTKLKQENIEVTVSKKKQIIIEDRLKTDHTYSAISAKSKSDGIEKGWERRTKASWSKNKCFNLDHKNEEQML